MAIGLPNIEVIFQGKANTAINRSAKGVACLIIEDETNETKVISYKNLSEVDAEHYTEENYNIISDVFMSDVSKLTIIRLTDSEKLANVKGQIAKDINWIAYITDDSSEQKALADFVKAENKSRIRRLKGLVYKVSNCDDMHVVNFVNETVTKVDDEPIEGHLYLGRLLGILAACRMDQSVTYKKLTDLEAVAELSDVNAAINKGDFALFNDDDHVRIGRGVTTLQANDKNHTEDMKYIAIVESMDLIYEDVIKTFKETYIGKFKNSYDNQVLFISAINSYFRSLQADEVLDPNFDNQAGVNVEKQREMWISNGTIDAEAWSEKDVKNNTFRTNVYIEANVKFLNAIEDLNFVIEMQ